MKALCIAVNIKTDCSLTRIIEAETYDEIELIGEETNDELLTKTGYSDSIWAILLVDECFF